MAQGGLETEIAKMPDKEWSFSEFRLRQILPNTSGMKAVYAYASEDHAGKYYLKEEEIHFVGVADETVIWMRRSEGQDVGREFERERVTGSIVGIIVWDGFEHIVNEDNNFCGFSMPGQDMRECNGQMGHEYRKNLLDEFKVKSDD